MKSVLDNSVREELINRIHTINGESYARWGKMNVYQMLLHCTHCEEMFLGDLKIKRVFIGRLIGKIVLKQVLKDEKPIRRNSPTAEVLKIAGESGDVEQQKNEWVQRIEQYAGYNRTDFVHPFFGPMTKEQVGLLAYKHTDHHLRQFGA